MPPAAESTRFVSVSSSARLSPTSRGRNQLDEPSGVSPTAVYAITNFVDTPATTRSEAPTRPSPAPAALPCTAATTGASPRTSMRDRAMQRRQHRAHEPGEVLAGRREALHVSPTAETRAVARQQDGAHAVVLLDRDGRRKQVVGQRDVDAVGVVRSVQREVGDAVAHLELDRFERVGRSHGRRCYGSAVAPFHDAAVSSGSRRAPRAGPPAAPAMRRRSRPRARRG